MRRRVGACVCQKCRGHPVSITQLSRYFATRRAQLQSKWSPARMIAGRCGGNRGGGGNTRVDGGKYSRYVRTATKGSLPWQANSQQEARGNLPRLKIDSLSRHSKEHLSIHPVKVARTAAGKRGGLSRAVGACESQSA